MRDIMAYSIPGPPQNDREKYLYLYSQLILKVIDCEKTVGSIVSKFFVTHSFKLSF